MIDIDPMAPNLSEKRRQVLRIRDKAIAVAEKFGRPNPSIRDSPNYFFKRRAIEILYLPLTYRLEVWAADIRGPGPALTAVAVMTKVAGPIHVIFGEPQKVFNISWQSVTSAIRVASFVRGHWENYLLGGNPEHMM